MPSPPSLAAKARQKPLPSNRQSALNLRSSFPGIRLSKIGPTFITLATPKLTCCFPKGSVASFLLETKMAGAMKQKTDVLQGTLALMVLKTLDVLGSLHGYGIARRIEQISGDLLAVNQG